MCCGSGDYRIGRSSHYEGTRSVPAGSGMTATERIGRGWGLPQWKLPCALVGKRVVLKPGERLRIGWKGDGTWKYSARDRHCFVGWCSAQQAMLEPGIHGLSGLSSRNDVIGNTGS